MLERYTHTSRATTAMPRESAPQNMTNLNNVRPAKNQVSLGIHSVWSESSQKDNKETLLCSECVDEH